MTTYTVPRTASRPHHTVHATTDTRNALHRRTYALDGASLLLSTIFTLSFICDSFGSSSFVNKLLKKTEKLKKEDFHKSQKILLFLDFRILFPLFSSRFLILF